MGLFPFSRSEVPHKVTQYQNQKEALFLPRLLGILVSESRVEVKIGLEGLGLRALRVPLRDLQ